VAPVPVAPESPVRISSAPKKVDPSLDLAHQAFNRGDLDLAQTHWKKALAKDPRNSDALHGMAAIALQNQQPAQAADYYLKALENDPKDALAVSGLLSLKAPTDVMQAESRLKTLLAEQPDSPHLNFAIGNLFSRSARWADAQQAYFKAHTGDPANPDYLFNLAVSLDQLHQSRLAAQYYQQALNAATAQPAGFDTAQVTTRLKALQSGLQP
jgi:Tfp pilus assembly protein PilF